MKKPNHFVSLLDLDGVTADYDLALLKAHGLTRTPEIHNRIKAGEAVHSILGRTWQEEKEFMKTLGKEHWGNMGIFPWTYDLYSSLQKLGEVAFLTSTGKVSLPAAQGKQDWCWKHFKNHNIIITKEKWLCAKPNSILIDDEEGNRKTPEESNGLNFEKFGGNSLLFPNYAKMLDGEISYSSFKEELIHKIIGIKKELGI